MKKILQLYPAEAAHMPGLKTWRALPVAGLDYLDPFILLNHHGPEHFPPHNQGLPFGPHPHRGFETLTFIFAGDLVHSDSTGEVSRIEAGGVQWMTAGKGIVHSELASKDFEEKGGGQEILQLWMNLPRELKMTEPVYRGYPREALRHFSPHEGIRLALISGELMGHKGPHTSLTDLMMSYVDLEPGVHWEHEPPEGKTVFYYLVNGELKVNGQQASTRNLIRFDEDGGAILTEAQQHSRLIYGWGEPLREPMVAQGPFVMNSIGEIKQAFLDYQAGKFKGR